MGELTLLILRLVFLAVLWVFIFSIVYALRSDLFGQKVRRMPADAPADPFIQAAAAPAPAPAPVPVSSPAAPTAPVSRAPFPAPSQPSASTPTHASRLVITSGPKEGLEIELPREQLTIGRSAESGLVIRDDYTSTHHARL
ncbi:MAG TPA: FHA domain-containing protein, partial [Glaciihabitans sp.]|nr:FHA domain-containing protein [Glaciihabitans sp.]